MTRTEIENEIVRLKAVYDAIKSTNFDSYCKSMAERYLEYIRRDQQRHLLMLEQKI